jgi:hypothetical protein
VIVDTVVVEFTRDIVLHNACLGHDLTTGNLVCAKVFRAKRGQWAKVHSGMLDLLVPGCAKDPFAPPEKPAVEVPETPADPVPWPAYRPPSRVGKPKPAMDQSRIGRRGADAPETCGRDVWVIQAGQYQPCAQKRGHRDQCRSQTQIDARTAAQRERRRSARE